MRTRSGVTGAAVLVAVLLLSAGAAQAGGEAGGDITFRLVLRGDVIDGDNFSLAVNDLGPTGLIISPGVRCGPGSEVYNPGGFVPCQPGAYEFTVPGLEELPVGTELEYVWARNYGSEADRQADVIYRDTVTITENAQVFTVVYEYPGGAQLPNTAMPTPAGGVPLGALAIIGGVLVALAAAPPGHLRLRGY
jgi:hypothetical protein